MRVVHITVLTGILLGGSYGRRSDRLGRGAQLVAGRVGEALTSALAI